MRLPKKVVLESFQALQCIKKFNIEHSWWRQRQMFQTPAAKMHFSDQTAETRRWLEESSH